MAFDKKLRSYFFGAFANNSRGKQTGLKNDDQPNQSRFEELTASSPFFAEEDDRAKESAAGDLKDEQGLAVLASDVQAKANAAQLADRSLVTQPHQLPDVDATETQDMDGATSSFSDIAMEVTVDAGVTTRNSFLIKLRESFRAWLEVLRQDVDVNTTDIATNESDIATNTTNIGTNATNIGTNTTNIGINAGDIVTLDGRVTDVENVQVTQNGRLDDLESGDSGPLSSAWTTVSNPAGTDCVITTLSGSTSTANAYTFFSGTEEYHYLIAGKTMFIQLNIDLTIQAPASPSGEVVTMFVSIPNSEQSISYQLYGSFAEAIAGSPQASNDSNGVVFNTNAVSASWDHIGGSDLVTVDTTPLATYDVSIKGMMTIPLV